MPSDSDTEPAGASEPARDDVALGDADTLAGDSTKTGARQLAMGPHARVRRALSGSDQAPTEIGDFAIERALGSGGMGTVYLATDTRLDRRVALKLVRADRVSERAHARLLREARALGRLAHPNVVPVFEVGEHEGLVYVAMEYVVGTTLREALAEREREPDEIVGMFRQAGDGLAAAHAEGLIHRDFKPDNVLVGRDGRVRVVDFGLVAAHDEAAPETVVPDELARVVDADVLTRTGDLLGTPAYMAPEQYEGRATTPATDQFAFCVALYEALERRRPFRGETLPQLARAVTCDDPDPMSRTPEPLRASILRGLQRDPAARFEGMPALLEALSDPSAVPPASRRPLVAALFGLAVVSGVALTLISRDDRPVASDAAESEPTAAPSPIDPPPPSPDRESSEPTRLATSGHLGISSVAADPKGAWVAYAESDGSFVVLRSGRKPMVLPVRAIPLAIPTSEGSALYAATDTEVLRIEEDGARVPVVLEGDPVGVVGLSPDHRRVVVARTEPQDYTELVDLKGETPPVRIDFTLKAPPRFSADSRWLAVVGPASQRVEILAADGRLRSTVDVPHVTGASWDGEGSLLVAARSELTSDNVTRIHRCPVDDGIVGACSVAQEISDDWAVPLSFHGRYGDGLLFTMIDLDTQRVTVLDLDDGGEPSWSTPPAGEHSSSAGWIGDADLAFFTDRFGEPTVIVERLDRELSEANGSADDRSFLAWGLASEPRTLFRVTPEGQRIAVREGSEATEPLVRHPSCDAAARCTVLVREPDGESFAVASIDPARGATDSRWRLSATQIRDYSVSPDGTRIAILDQSHGAVYDVGTGRRLADLPSSAEQPALAVALGNAGRPSYTATLLEGKHQVRRVEPDGHEELLLTSDRDAVAGLRLSPTGRWLAVELTQLLPALVVVPPG